MQCAIQSALLYQCTYSIFGLHVDSLPYAPICAVTKLLCDLIPASNALVLAQQVWLSDAKQYQQKPHRFMAASAEAEFSTLRCER